MKVYLDTIGCRLNQSEIEKMAGQFRAAGHEIVESASEAEWVVVNTCSVTSEAASDSRQKIRQAARAGAKEILVTGCWSTLEPSAAGALDGVTVVVPNDHKAFLVSDFLKIPLENFDFEPLAREPLPGIHQKTRAFIKVQDGCDNHCTFCVTRLARGAGKSLDVSEVLRDVQAALTGGAKEIVLSGVHLGSWGQDFEKPDHLWNLIEAILRETDVVRLRLSSLEPWDLDEAFFSLWMDSRMCRHLHLPLQSGSASVLKRMVRKTTPDEFAHLVALARAVAPDMAITTDMIVGFPGEIDREFEESLHFVRKIGFSGGHVFSYSSRPGTAAARMTGQLSGPVKKARSAALRAVFQESAERYQQRFIGRETTVLWESSDGLGPSGWRMQGLTDNYLRVSAVSRDRLWNQISRVRLLDRTDQGLNGEILPEQ